MPGPAALGERREGGGSAEPSSHRGGGSCCYPRNDPPASPAGWGWDGSALNPPVPQNAPRSLRSLGRSRARRRTRRIQGRGHPRRGEGAQTGAPPVHPTPRKPPNNRTPIPPGPTAHPPPRFPPCPEPRGARGARGAGAAVPHPRRCGAVRAVRGRAGRCGRCGAGRGSGAAPSSRIPPPPPRSRSGFSSGAAAAVRGRHRGLPAPPRPVRGGGKRDPPGGLRSPPSAAFRASAQTPGSVPSPCPGMHLPLPTGPVPPDRTRPLKPSRSLQTEPAFPDRTGPPDRICPPRAARCRPHLLGEPLKGRQHRLSPENPPG
ncbi:uncharacterized protein LOC134420915 [Melospiza melodia melodia]|uniref:uncharacterized protein LOC134420915 n=1 Tax=Melospiza melodia melodia TaxID=1914991 RepID=UPI002FD196FB